MEDRTAVDNHKFRIVNKWLKRKFGDKPIPEFEITSETIDVLYNLAVTNEECDREADLIIKEYKQKEKEYRSEGERLEKILSTLGLGVLSLSESGRDSLNILTEVAILLDLKDASETSILLGLQELEKEWSDIVDARAEKSTTYERVLRGYKSAIQQLQKLTDFLQTCKEEAEEMSPILKDFEAEIKFCVMKSKEYKSQLQELNKVIKQTGYNENITHSALLSMSKELNSIEKETQNLQAHSDAYSNLPPDIELARLEVARAKQQRDNLEYELSDIYSAVGDI